MSYAMAAALQAAIYQRLKADMALAALAPGGIHDALPPGNPPDTCVVIGPEEVRERSDHTGAGAEHRLTISVISPAAGFQAAKAAAVAVSDALAGADLALARGRLVGLWFERAQARRVEKGMQRRIDLTFRARVEE